MRDSQGYQVWFCELHWALTCLYGLMPMLPKDLLSEAALIGTRQSVIVE